MLDFLGIKKPILEAELENHMIIKIRDVILELGFGFSFISNQYMNFYLNLLDDFVKHSDENPSIGIIMCSQRNRFEIEYTLRGLSKPVGVSEYQLTKVLPKEFEDKLPNVASLEKALNDFKIVELA